MPSMSIAPATDAEVAVAGTSAETTRPLAARYRHFWFAAALVFVSLRGLPNLSYPVSRDQSTYCVIAEGLLRGERLYRELWDNKPHGIFYIFTPVVKLF